MNAYNFNTDSTIIIYIYIYTHTLMLDGDYYTDALCEAMVMCGNNHWIFMPNITIASHWASV